MPKRDSSQSAKWFRKANRFLPGGVNSPVRAFRAVQGIPPFIARGQGCRLFDEDGNDYIDFVGSWGPLILGHAHPEVVKAIGEAAAMGTSFGAPTRAEVDLAEAVCGAFPSVAKVRMVNSGTEATLSAVRLARAFTGREMIVKAEGCYHGHVDSLLVQAGSGLLTLAIPGSPGIPEATVRQTLNVPYNDLPALGKCLTKYRGKIACLILEPVAANMGVVAPNPGYLEGVRELTRRDGIVLIFDEVITGFRVAFGGAQEHYGIEPDLTTLGKILGGGLPVGAYGGGAEIMGRVAPEGDVYQAGTLSGNPLAMRAGRATLEILQKNSPYERLEKLSARLEQGLDRAAAAAGVPVRINRVGSLLSIFFTDRDVGDYQTAATSDAGSFRTYFHAMLDRGIYLAPSPFEAMFVSTAHSEAEIDRTVEVAGEAFAGVARGKS